MLKRIWYQIIRIYVKTGLLFLHKKITIHGAQNIPKKGALLFIPNHQNALVDAILIPTTNHRNTHFLARAGVFKNDFVAKFLSTVNMLPVYRIRDGINTVENNLAIFEKCFEILKQEKAIEIFAEGEHHIERRILPLKKGFGRIILGSLKKHPELEIQIVPVGINFDAHLSYPSSVSIYYGKPIKANDYINVENPDLKFTEIIKVVTSAMKKLTLHVKNTEDYDAIIKKLNANGINYLNPFEANQMLKSIDELPNNPPLPKQPTNWFAPLHFIAKLNSIFPLLIWRKLKKGISDKLFINTFRFALIATLFPLFYVLQSAVISYFFNWKIALVYLLSSIVLGIISTKTTHVNPQ